MRKEGKHLWVVHRGIAFANAFDFDDMLVAVERGIVEMVHEDGVRQVRIDLTALVEEEERYEAEYRIYEVLSAWFKQHGWVEEESDSSAVMVRWRKDLVCCEFVNLDLYSPYLRIYKD